MCRLNWFHDESLIQQSANLPIYQSSNSKRLADAEVHTPAALLRLPIEPKTGERPELITKVETNQTERRVEPQAWPGVITEIAQPNRPRILPDVAGFDEDRAAKPFENHNARLCGCR